MSNLAIQFLAAACSYDAQPADIVRYLEACDQDHAARGEPPRVLADFYDPDVAGADVAAAMAWWPVECPPTLRWESCMAASLSSYNVVHAATGETIAGALARAAARVVAWLRSEGRDVVRPNETKSDRMRRMNRERVARHREGQRASGPCGQDPVAAQWRRVKELEAARDEAVAPLDVVVRDAQAAFLTACAARKEERARWDVLTDEARAEHRRLKGV